MANARLQVVLNHLGNKNTPIYKLKRTAYTRNRQFRYTLDNPLLSLEQREFYEKNGFLLLKKFIEPELLEQCRLQFIEICEGRAERGYMTVMKDVSLRKTNAKGEFLYNKIQDIVYDPVFENYIMHERLLDIVECFTGPNIMAVHSMLINKPPDSGKETSQHPLHQDLHYFPFRPADRIVASWTAMEPVTPDNGCLFVLPGTHVNPGVLLPHDYPEADVNLMYHGIRGFDHVPKVMLPMDPGDTVFFHPLLIHGSGVNITKGFRKAISCHYATSDSYFIDVRGTTQANIGKEVESVAVKKFNAKLTFEEIWKMKSRLVRGENTNFK